MKPPLAFVSVFLICCAVASRLLPHPPNFTSAPALALVAGACLGRSWLAFAVPIAVMVFTDAVLGAMVYGLEAFRYAVPVYAAMALTVLIGNAVSRTVGGLIAGALGSTAIFFFVANAAVWLWSGLYPSDLGGLVACYVAALPFAANMLASTLLYTVTLFALLSWADRRVLASSRAR